MSQFMQLFTKNMSPNSTPSSPSSTKKEGRFRKFKRNGNRSSVNEADSGTNLSKQRSVSMSALVQMKESPSDEPKDWLNKHRKRNSTLSMVPKNVDTYEETEHIVSEPKNQISVKELIEKMILHLQVLERKNEILNQNIEQLNEEKTSLETELSSAKVELNLYKNRLNQIEKLCDEWHCSLCTDNKIKIISTKRVIVSLFCGHIFCSSCAQNLMSTSRLSKHCPTCRKPLKEGQLNYHPIYC